MNKAVETDSLQRRRGISTDINMSYIGVPTNENDKGGDEKPWQRVIYEITKKGTHLYEPVKSVPSTLIILLLGVYLLLGYLTQLVEDDMPAVINESDITRDNAAAFSEEVAQRYLVQLTGDEPRVAGTRYHYLKTQELKALVDSIAAQATLPVHTDWQIVSGDYILESSAPFVNFYQNVSNIIAVVEGNSGFHANGTIGSSILVNCHYDSVPYALGASDNMVFCAAMLETLSRVSRRQDKLEHNLVFLFNGAEENPLQASHAFLHHEWSKGVTSVVNLDAAGMNGKATIFQVSDPRVLAAYRRAVNRPGAQGVGEFLFTTGIIPSDTDFRIWRDFGHFHGIDIAFAKWGHVYHTRYDHPSVLHRGVLQWAGDMLLGLATQLGDLHELGHKMEPEAAVYFDYMYLFLVTCPLSAAAAVDVVVALFALSTVAYFVWMVGPRWSTVREVLWSCVGRLAAMLSGILLTAILVPIMVATTIQMRYLTQPWIVVPIFWMPYLLAVVVTSQAFDAWRTKKSGLNRSIRTLQAMSATRLLLAVTLLVMACIPTLTTMRYLVTVPLFVTSLMALVSLTVVRCVRLQAWQHLLLEVVLSLPSTMFTYTLALRLDAMMLPIMGRSSSDTPDYTVAVINVGLAIIVSTTVSGIELLFSRKRLWMVLSPVAVACLIIMFVPFSPYSDDGPSTQRHYWFHTQITSHNSTRHLISRTSGVLITKYDPYTTQRVLPALTAAGINLNSRNQFIDDCLNKVYCDLPVFRSSTARFLSRALFLYTGPPNAFSPAASFTAERTCVGETCTYHFLMTGANHNTLTIWPHRNVNLTSWTLSSTPKMSFMQDNRPVYVVGHSIATYTDNIQPTSINVTFIVPLSLQSQPVMSVSHHSHKIHHPQDYTDEYRSILQAMPKYFNIASFLTFRDNYEF